jgi:hypothetical protein
MSDDVFAQMERDHKEFLRRLEDALEQEITGLVDASGSAGGKGDSDLWNLIIHLAAWRESTGIIHRKEMRVEIPVSEEELLRQMGAIKAYSLLGLRLRFADHPNGRKRCHRRTVMVAHEPKQGHPQRRNQRLPKHHFFSRRAHRKRNQGPP